MSEHVIRIRPRAQYLKKLATLDSHSPPKDDLPDGVSVSLELKLDTPDTRYWLCSVGLPQPQPGMPKSWVVDYITPEHRLNDGTWSLDESEAYGTDSTAWLQGSDYLHMLTSEYDRLKQLQEKDDNWQTKQQLEVTEDEMRQVRAQLDAILAEKQMQRQKV